MGTAAFGGAETPKCGDAAACGNNAACGSACGSTLALRRPATRVVRDGCAVSNPEWLGDEMPSSKSYPAEETMWLYGRQPQSDALPERLGPPVLPQSGDDEQAGQAIQQMSTDPRAKASANLLRAARSGQLTLSRRAIEQKADVNHRTDQGISPLMLAAASAGKWAVEVLDELLWHSAELEVEDNLGMTAFHHACLNGIIESVKHLMKKEADPCRVTGSGGKTSVMLAVEAASLPIVSLLLRHKPVRAKVSAKASSSGLTALHVAVREGHTNIAHVLLDKNARVNARDQDGMQPLMIACVHNHCVNLLVTKLAEVNGQNRFMQSPLMLAVMHKHCSLAVWLFEEAPNYGKKVRADPMSKDEAGDTPFGISEEVGLSKFRYSVLNHVEYRHEGEELTH